MYLCLGVGLGLGLSAFILPRVNGAEKSLEFGKYGTENDFSLCISELQKSLPEGTVATAEDELIEHGYSDNDYHPHTPHTVVVYPTCTEDVVTIVKLSRKYRMPITPYSGGTSLEGGFRGAASGGICVDMSRMDKVLAIREKDADMTVQPGIGWVDVNALLKERGINLFFPLDPGPGATIGGMLSTGCSGTNAVRYGTAKAEWFLNATVVLPNGEVIKTRQRARKSSAGWDVTKLFIGAEGTLGIVTEVTIRLTPVLPTTVAVVHFPSAQQAVESVEEIMQSSIYGRVQCVELVDTEFMRATNMHGQSKRKWQEKDSLFIKIQDTGEGYKFPLKVLKKITSTHGGFNFMTAASEEEAQDLWADRKNALYSGLALVEGSRGWSTDVCVPPSSLPILISQTKEDIKASGLTASIVGHVGDGNFHALLNIRPGEKESEEDLMIAKGVVSRMIERAIALEGTCTGEHGVGIGKKRYLTKELGKGTIGVMKTVKRALDEGGLFNPGKLYPDDELDDSETSTTK